MFRLLLVSILSVFCFQVYAVDQGQPDSTIQLLASDSLVELLKAHSTENAKRILALITKIPSKEDRVLNIIKSVAMKDSLSDAIEALEKLYKCTVFESENLKFQVMPKNPVNNYILVAVTMPVEIKNNALFLLDLVATKGDNKMIYEWLFKISDQKMLTIKIAPMKNDILVTIRNYPIVYFE